jgi:hypothetical protein
VLRKCAYFFEETEEGGGGAGGAVTYLLGGHGSGKTVILARCVSVCTFVLAEVRQYMYFCTTDAPAKRLFWLGWYTSCVNWMRERQKIPMQLVKKI